MQLSKHHTILIAATSVFFLSIFSVAIWKYMNFQYNALDLAIFNQTFFNTVHGNWFATSIHPPSYLTDHIAPIIIALAPLYAIWQHPLMLVLLQTLALILTVVPLYLLGKKINTKNTGLLLALLWLTNPFVLNTAVFEFHLLPFAALMSAWIFYAYYTKRFKLYVTLLLLLLLIREDMALVVFGFGLLSLIDRRTKRWSLTALLSSVFYFGVVMFIKKYLGGDYKFLIYYSWLGDSWLAILQTGLLRPWRVFQQLLHPANILVLGGLLLPTGLLALRSWRPLLVAMPILAQLLLGSSPSNAGVLLQTHYSCVLVVPLLIAVAFAFARYHKSPPRWLTFFEIKRPNKALVMLVSMATIYSTFTLGPIAYLYAQHPYEINELSKIKELLATIPDDSAVMASYALLPQLSNRPTVAALPYGYLKTQQFALTDYTPPAEIEYLVVDINDYLTFAAQFADHPLYRTVYQKNSSDWSGYLNNFELTDRAGDIYLYRRLNSQNNTTPAKLTDTELVLSDNLAITAFTRDTHFITLQLTGELESFQPIGIEFFDPTNGEQLSLQLLGGEHPLQSFDGTITVQQFNAIELQARETVGIRLVALKNDVTLNKLRTVVVMQETSLNSEQVILK